MNGRATRPAGAFTVWLDSLLAAVRDASTSAVPCDGCTACRAASQFVHIGPDESETLASIPAPLLFPAPGLPDGHVLMGYDEDGRCPMLVDDRCSIYEQRPRTCRTYDCRVFAASAVDPGEGKEAVAARAAEWQFEHPTEQDRVRHDAVRAAAAYLERRRGDLPAGAVPSNPTQLAVLAIGADEAFLDGTRLRPDPDPDAVAVAVALRNERFPQPL